MVWKSAPALTAILLLAIFSGGCNKEPDSKPSLPADGRRVYVVCEGSLGSGNASLDVYLPEKDSSYTDAFASANGGKLGDVAQSALMIGDRIFVCVNNSDKIVVLDKSTLKLKQEISIRKPRYMVQLSDSVAMVSSLFSNKLFRLSLHSLTVTDSIALGRQNPEAMLLQTGLLYVCPWDKAAEHIYVVEDGRRVKDSIPVGKCPHSIVLDAEQKAWVLSGNAPNGVTAKLTRVDLAGRQALTTYTFPAGADPIRPCFNPGRDTLYYLGVNYTGGTAYNGVFRMKITDAGLPMQPFIQAQSLQYFWALGIDPSTGNIYVGDPKGFTQRGSVSVYTPAGNLVSNFATGVGPGYLLFE